MHAFFITDVFSGLSLVLSIVLLVVVGLFPVGIAILYLRNTEKKLTDETWMKKYGVLYSELDSTKMSSKVVQLVPIFE
jgi:hypothetical protein